MGISNLKIITPAGKEDPLADTRHGNKQRVQRFRHLLRGYIDGSIRLSTTGTVMRRGLRRAFGTLALSSGADAVGGVINGVTITDTWATSDTVSAGLIATAINASTDPLVQYLVEASNIAGTLTLSGALASVTVDICGFKFRSVGTATPTGVDEFTIAGTDTADAASLAAAINKHPAASHFLRATNSSGVVTVWLTSGSIPTGFTNRLIGATGITAGAATLAAGATVYVTSLDKGEVGNMCTLAASGTGVTASGARLTGGTSSTAVT